MSKVDQVAETMAADGSGELSGDDALRLLDDLALHLADAAHQGILLTSGHLSRRKTEWVLARLSDELGCLAELVEKLRRES